MALLGSPQTRTHTPSLLDWGIRKVAFDEYDLYEKQFEQIYPIVDSKKESEKDAVMAGLGIFGSKDEGGTVPTDNMQEAWTKTFVHTTYSTQLRFTEEALEDELYGVNTQAGKELARSAAYTEEVNAMTLFNSLSATVYTASSTNYTLLSTSHFRVDGGTWSNRPTVAVDLSIESYEALLTQWATGMLDQRGRKIAEPPAVLLVGRSDEWIASRILDSDKRPFSNDNDPNVAKLRRNIKLVVSDFMTDDGRWFLLGAKERTGLRYHVRMPFSVKRADHPESGDLLMRGRFRVSSGAYSPFGLMGSP